MATEQMYFDDESRFYYVGRSPSEFLNVSPMCFGIPIGNLYAENRTEDDKKKLFDISKLRGNTQIFDCERLMMNAAQVTRCVTIDDNGMQKYTYVRDAVNNLHLGLDISVKLNPSEVIASAVGKAVASPGAGAIAGTLFTGSNLDLNLNGYYDFSKTSSTNFSYEVTNIYYAYHSMYVGERKSECLSSPLEHDINYIKQVKERGGTQEELGGNFLNVKCDLSIILIYPKEFFDSNKIVLAKSLLERYGHFYVSEATYGGRAYKEEVSYEVHDFQSVVRNAELKATYGIKEKEALGNKIKENDKTNSAAVNGTDTTRTSGRVNRQKVIGFTMGGSPSDSFDFDDRDRKRAWLVSLGRDHSKSLAIIKFKIGPIYNLIQDEQVKELLKAEYEKQEELYNIKFAKLIKDLEADVIFDFKKKQAEFQNWFFAKSPKSRLENVYQLSENGFLNIFPGEELVKVVIASGENFRIYKKTMHLEYTKQGMLLVKLTQSGWPASPPRILWQSCERYQHKDIIKDWCDNTHSECVNLSCEKHHPYRCFFDHENGILKLQCTKKNPDYKVITYWSTKLPKTQAQINNKPKGYQLVMTYEDIYIIRLDTNEDEKKESFSYNDIFLNFGVYYPVLLTGECNYAVGWDKRFTDIYSEEGTKETDDVKTDDVEEPKRIINHGWLFWRRSMISFDKKDIDRYGLQKLLKDDHYPWTKSTDYLKL